MTADEPGNSITERIEALEFALGERNGEVRTARLVLTDWEGQDRISAEVSNNVAELAILNGNDSGGDVR